MLFLDSIKPETIATVDASKIPDNVLASNIGSYYGNVYEKMLNGNRKSNLN